MSSSSGFSTSSEFKLVLALLLVLVVGGIVVFSTNAPSAFLAPPIQDNTPLTLSLNAGWNLIKVPGDFSSLAGTCEKDSMWVFFYDSANNKYSDAKILADAMGNAADVETGKKSSFWTYTPNKCTLDFGVTQKMAGRGVLKISQGWNFLPITDDMLGESLNKLATSCKLNVAYTFDSAVQNWALVHLDKILTADIGSVVLYSDNACIIESLAPPPPPPPPPTTGGGEAKGKHTMLTSYLGSAVTVDGKITAEDKWDEADESSIDYGVYYDAADIVDKKGIFTVKTKHDNDKIYFLLMWDDTNPKWNAFVNFYFEDDGATHDHVLDTANDHNSYTGAPVYGCTKDLLEAAVVADPRHPSGINMWIVQPDGGPSRSACAYSNGKWIFEAEKKLNSGSPTDISVPVGTEKLLGFAVADMEEDNWEWPVDDISTKAINQVEGATWPYNTDNWGDLKIVWKTKAESTGGTTESDLLRAKILEAVERVKTYNYDSTVKFDMSLKASDGTITPISTSLDVEGAVDIPAKKMDVIIDSFSGDVVKRIELYFEEPYYYYYSTDNQGWVKSKAEVGIVAGINELKIISGVLDGAGVQIVRETTVNGVDAYIVAVSPNVESYVQATSTSAGTGTAITKETVDALSKSIKSLNAQFWVSKADYTVLQAETNVEAVFDASVIFGTSSSGKSIGELNYKINVLDTFKNINEPVSIVIPEGAAELSR